MKKVVDFLGNQSIWVLCFTSLLILVCSCSHMPPEYLEAVENAANPQPDEIYSDLTPISSANTELVRKNVDGEEFVLVVSWVGDASYYRQTDQKGFYNTGRRDIWVTVVPELKERCAEPGFGGDDIGLRLKQLLGMPRSTKKSNFVEFWVRTEELFRPCPDAEIDDRRCELNLPNHVTQKHRKWFNSKRAESYCHKEGCRSIVPYPWTQLGYTFDWGSTAPHIGLSEFVIEKESDVFVNRIVPTLEYCRGD